MGLEYVNLFLRSIQIQNFFFFFGGGSGEGGERVGAGLE